MLLSHSSMEKRISPGLLSPPSVAISTIPGKSHTMPSASVCGYCYSFDDHNFLVSSLITICFYLWNHMRIVSEINIEFLSVWPGDQILADSFIFSFLVWWRTNLSTRKEILVYCTIFAACIIKVCTSNCRRVDVTVRNRIHVDQWISEVAVKNDMNLLNLSKFK